ncbi:hypothetical protein E4U52_005992 [Claviceps spartinae]|nr:hypothetical protein E4U52_005992 [Claviceps spartinae]
MSKLRRPNLQQRDRALRKALRLADLAPEAYKSPEQEQALERIMNATDPALATGVARGIEAAPSPVGSTTTSAGSVSFMIRLSACSCSEDFELPAPDQPRLSEGLCPAAEGRKDQMSIQSESDSVSMLSANDEFILLEVQKIFQRRCRFYLAVWWA